MYSEFRKNFEVGTERHWFVELLSLAEKNWLFLSRWAAAQTLETQVFVLSHPSTVQTD